MNGRDRGIAVDLLLAFLFENAESDEDRAGWERARGRALLNRESRQGRLFL